MTTPYNRDYDPPAPALQIHLGAPGGPFATEPFAALIDTGADMTIVPKEIVLTLHAPALAKAHLHSPWGEPHPIVIYLVDIGIDGARFVGIEVAADETTDEITLGRNVLNKLPMFLDGPARVTDLLNDATVQRLRSARGR